MGAERRVGGGGAWHGPAPEPGSATVGRLDQRRRCAGGWAAVGFWGGLSGVEGGGRSSMKQDPDMKGNAG